MYGENVDKCYNFHSLEQFIVFLRCRMLLNCDGTGEQTSFSR